MDETQADGERGSDRRFDPVAGMRAMADIQAEGLRAAGDLIERMLGSEPDGRGPAGRAPAADYGALVEAWMDLLRRTFAAFTPAAQNGALTVPVDSSAVGPPIRLTVRGTVEVWLHNATFDAVGPLAMRCGPLADAAGTVLEGAEVCFEPHEVALLPARSSRAVAVSLDTSGSLRPGTYRGAIQAHGAPRLWLPLEITIEPR